jgi:hypothetical protein
VINGMSMYDCYWRARISHVYLFSYISWICLVLVCVDAWFGGPITCGSRFQLFQILKQIRDLFAEPAGSTEFIMGNLLSLIKKQI